jgi:ORC complex protein Cdc6/Orc1
VSTIRAMNINQKYFEKPWLLEIDNVPDANRIVGRDDKIKSLAKNLRKMRTDDVPDNIVMWG